MKLDLIYKPLIVLTASCLILSSCSSNQGSNVQETNDSQTVLSEPVTAQPDSTQSEPSDPLQESEPPDLTTEVEPTVELVPEIKYQINKAYRIEPIQEGTDSKVVLLTFDDGPKDEQMINDLIDVLDQHEAKAIFFVNGYRVKANPDLLKLIHQRGQLIGNHSWDHLNLKEASLEEVKRQIVDVQQIVLDTIGEKPVFFRPPFGAGNDNTHNVAEDNGLLYMTWSNGSLDWEAGSKNNPDAVVQNVLDQLHPGSNILMHELPWTVEAMDSLLTEIEARGYSFINPSSISLVPAK